MKSIVIASARRNSGKTSLVIGLAKALGVPCGYVKPFGDRMLCRKKRLWDYDAALVSHVLGLPDSGETATIGFERAKLRLMYTAGELSSKVAEAARAAGAGRDALLVEGGSDLAHGVSVGLDALSVARALGARLVVVAAGSDDAVVDDVAFLKQHVGMAGVDFAGVIVNKVQDLDDFKASRLDEINRMGVRVLGVLPHVPELAQVSVRYVADALFARVVAGEQGLDARVKTVFVGAMSADAAMRYPAFQKAGKLIITSGDRSDIVLAALDGNTAAVVLAHNILPPPNIISRASERGIPLLLVPSDTFQTAKQVDDMEPLITREETDKVAILGDLVAKHVDVAAL
ncbi:MAG: AAA family ATPase [Deltaproteobacteria bacterium]|nr:AAA family ATPase [Deltaproteobacteria bacterium]